MAASCCRHLTIVGEGVQTQVIIRWRATFPIGKEISEIRGRRIKMKDGGVISDRRTLKAIL